MEKGSNSAKLLALAVSFKRTFMFIGRDDFLLSSRKIVLPTTGSYGSIDRSHDVVEKQLYRTLRASVLNEVTR